MATCRELWSVARGPRGGQGRVGSIVGLILINIFVSAMGSGIEGTLSRFADSTELWGALTHRREGMDPEGPGQAGEVGLCETQEVQQSKVQGPTAGSGQSYTHRQLGWRND